MHAILIQDASSFGQQLIRQKGVIPFIFTMNHSITPARINQIQIFLLIILRCLIKQSILKASLSEARIQQIKSARKTVSHDPESMKRLVNSYNLLTKVNGAHVNNLFISTF